MTSPLPPDLAVELYYGGAWHDITSDVRVQQAVTARYGVPDEAARPDPSTCTLRLNNTHGRYSWRHPGSELYGLIGRNTPIRYRLGPPDVALVLTGAGGSYASTPHRAALNVGDLDLRLHVDLRSIQPGRTQALASKYLLSGDQRSWALWLDEQRRLLLRWSPDGTFASSVTPISTAPLPAMEECVLRCTLDVDNAGSRELRYWYGPSMQGPWTQLGDPRLGAPTTVYASTADVVLGQTPGIAVEGLTGRVRAFQLRSGIDGPPVADVDFGAQEIDRTTVVDTTGLTWTVTGEARLADRSQRWRGEVSEWPVRWDLSGNDSWASITGAGVLRRLRQGETPLESSLTRDLSHRSNIVAYWPLEDGPDATTFAPAVGPWVMYRSGDVKPASYSDLPASAPLPVVRAGRIYGNVAHYAPTAEQRVMAYVDIPADGVAAETSLLYVHTSGSIRRWNVTITPAGAPRVRAYDADGTQVVAYDAAGALNGIKCLFWLLLSQQGSRLDWHIGYLPVGERVALYWPNSVAGHTYGRVTHVRVGGVPAVDMRGLAVGHVSVMIGDVHGPFWSTAGTSLVAWAGETAAARMRRIADDAGIPLTILGSADETPPMGPLRSDTPLGVLNDCAQVDMGMLTDRHGRLTYRPRSTLYSQTPALELDYALGQVSAPFEPVDDDAEIRNDITVSRPSGSSERAVLEDGPLSIQPPPAGVGRYEQSLTLNLATDAQLVDQAAWRLHLGTVDELRIPTLRVNLAHPAMADLVDQVLAVGEGDRITITGLPDWMPPGPLDLIVRHIEESVGIATLERTFTCAPGQPWQVWVLEDDTYGRADTLDSTTTVAFGAGTDTQLVVATHRGPIWTTDPGQFPFDITVGGVRLRVTAITGETSPQTITVEQAPVNGVSRLIPAGTPVRLTHPAVVSL